LDNSSTVWPHQMFIIVTKEERPIAWLLGAS
jgi:hypothetical protein